MTQEVIRKMQENEMQKRYYKYLENQKKKGDAFMRNYKYSKLTSDLVWVMKCYNESANGGDKQSQFIIAKHQDPRFSKVNIDDTQVYNAKMEEALRWYHRSRDYVPSGNSLATYYMQKHWKNQGNNEMCCYNKLDNSLKPQPCLRCSELMFAKNL
ncbi:hypothetical protein M951_chr3178 (nucleomorph) [Lotharella oceanica]|uniref:Uncharacterized protein n=1 Tax=Lotharella oceanica TaxID=641309 RepID=A0A060D7F4_9EUKA|nr:hypothetical protein M951_chr127 [Lotharella oceanica]AIB09683.1 hypothetical protein M951_chr1204 [Lotharella oceanica]AIB09730.1 hypothetical protein M951_chr227 [Lotharella oceanica]AIB09886.1 hypothetical protein M951_chr2194 [Lotharella oceanica]AIB09933.1 hypothetical protein M951_chr327 [Lotharella oceanica]